MQPGRGWRIGGPDVVRANMVWNIIEQNFHPLPMRFRYEGNIVTQCAEMIVHGVKIDCPVAVVILG